MSISSVAGNVANKIESVVKYAYNNTTYYGGRVYSIIKNSVIKPIPTAMQKHLFVGVGVTAAANFVFLTLLEPLAQTVEKQTKDLRKGTLVLGAGLLVFNYMFQWDTGFPVNKMVPITIAISGIAIRALTQLRPSDESYTDLLAKKTALEAANVKLNADNEILYAEITQLKNQAQASGVFGTQQ